MYRCSVLSSVCPSVYPACDWFAAVGPAGRRYRSIAAAARGRSTARRSRCGQFHVYSWRRKLSTDLLMTRNARVFFSALEQTRLKLTPFFDKSQNLHPKRKFFCRNVLSIYAVMMDNMTFLFVTFLRGFRYATRVTINIRINHRFRPHRMHSIDTAHC